MAEKLQTLSKIFFAISGVCFVLAVFFWVFFKIPKVIGDLSGKTARKSIADMRAANEKSGIKSYKESRTNSERGKLTGIMASNGNSKKKNVVLDDDFRETGILSENKANVLDTEATALLHTETTGLLGDESVTEPLVDMTERIAVRSGGKKLEIIDEVMLIHTDEVIDED